MARRKHESKPAYSDDFIGPREPHVLASLPWPGFYDSRLSGEIDCHEEREAEYMAERDAGTEGDDKQPAHLQLSASDYAELLFHHCDYHKLHGMLAHSYCDAFDSVMGDDLGFDVGIKYESMDSPSYYNFETDRLFAHVPYRVARKLVKLAIGNRKRLRQVIRDRHESRSGFHSWYASDVSTWADKLLRFYRGDESALDHNELQTVIQAAWPDACDPDHAIYYLWSESGGGIYHEYDSAMNWQAFEADIAERRQDMQEAHDALANN